MAKTGVIVLGGHGKLGRSIVEAAKGDDQVELKGIVGREGPALLKIATSKDVVVDATRGDLVKANVTIVAELGCPYVLAATGYDDSTKKMIQEYSKKIPIVIAPNLSVGVVALNNATTIVASILKDAKIEIVETHHKNKKDAPSGTALALAQSIKQGSSKDPKVEIRSIREGEVIGEHRVLFLLDGEKVELSHSASSRTIFAKGALKAVRFVANAKPGLYTMKDVL